MSGAVEADDGAARGDEGCDDRVPVEPGHGEPGTEDAHGSPAFDDDVQRDPVDAVGAVETVDAVDGDEPAGDAHVRPSLWTE